MKKHRLAIFLAALALAFPASLPAASHKPARATQASKLRAPRPRALPHVRKNRL